MKFNEKGLIPAIVQDESTSKVLMLGYMNQESFDKTIDSGKVTFFSRSKKRLWTKGETSGNYLHLLSWSLDCDQDALLLKVRPEGPTCHKGDDTCWGEKNRKEGLSFIGQLERIISSRKESLSKDSYTSSLFQEGTHKIAQKVGEEAVELVIESMKSDEDLFLGEAADLMYHYLILLQDRGYLLADVAKILESRHKK